ncbi:MAG: hypothetical protein LBQ62_00280 [Candidatus Accumulibacter sp.]|nr:hypothetical protein [Accumulibacter sp.]
MREIIARDKRSHPERTNRIATALRDDEFKNDPADVARWKIFDNPTTWSEWI